MGLDVLMEFANSQPDPIIGIISVRSRRSVGHRKIRFAEMVY